VSAWEAYIAPPPILWLAHVFVGCRGGWHRYPEETQGGDHFPWPGRLSYSHAHTSTQRIAWMDEGCACITLSLGPLSQAGQMVQEGRAGTPGRDRVVRRHQQDMGLLQVSTSGLLECHHKTMKPASNPNLWLPSLTRTRTRTRTRTLGGEAYGSQAWGCLCQDGFGECRFLVPAPPPCRSLSRLDCRSLSRLDLRAT